MGIRELVPRFFKMGKSPEPTPEAKSRPVYEAGQLFTEIGEEIDLAALGFGAEIEITTNSGSVYVIHRVAPMDVITFEVLSSSSEKVQIGSVAIADKILIGERLGFIFGAENTRVNISPVKQAKIINL